MLRIFTAESAEAQIDSGSPKDYKANRIVTFGSKRRAEKPSAFRHFAILRLGNFH
jgi:hypothetical protein